MVEEEREELGVEMEEETDGALEEETVVVEVNRDVCLLANEFFAERLFVDQRGTERSIRIKDRKRSDSFSINMICKKLSIMLNLR